MLGWWAEDPRLPEYINRLEDTQRKSARAHLPIMDDWLAAIATMALLSSGSFLMLRLDWDGLAPTAKTWPAWKAWARKAQKMIERKQCASGHHGKAFGSTSAATAIHGIPTMPSHTNASTGLPTLSELNRHLDNMAAVVTNEKAVLKALVSTNAELTKLSAEKILKIEQLLVGIKSTGPRAPQSTATVTTMPADMHAVSQLCTAIKHKWIPGAFCSTYSWGIGRWARPQQRDLQDQETRPCHLLHTCQPPRTWRHPKQGMGRLPFLLMPRDHSYP